MTTGATPWRATGNTTLTEFRSAIARSIGAGTSPMAAEADAVYAAVAASQLSRLAVAMAWHETKNMTWNCDTAPSGEPCIPPECRNPWAVTGPGPVGMIGRWSMYRTYASAAADWTRRLTDPARPYAATQTIAELIHVYAPTEDGNNEQAYVDAVCREIDALPVIGGNDVGTSATKSWQVAGMGQPIVLPADIRFEQRLIPAGQTNQRPGLAMDAAYWTQHDTANTKPGADAEMHYRWLRDGAPGADSATGQVGFHFVVDDKIVIQLIPVDEIAWHAGDGYSGVGNRRSMGCELCVNEDRNAQLAERNAAELAAAMIRARGWPMDRLRSHYSWVQGIPGGHFCPESLLSTGRWDGWVQQVSSAVKATTQVIWPNKPSWLPDSAVLLLFPEAMANGPRTNAIFQYWGKVGRAPARQAFLNKGTPDELIQLYDGTLVDVKGKIVGAA